MKKQEIVKKEYVEEFKGESIKQEDKEKKGSKIKNVFKSLFKNKDEAPKNLSAAELAQEEIKALRARLEESENKNQKFGTELKRLKNEIYGLKNKNHQLENENEELKISNKTLNSEVMVLKTNNKDQ